MRKHIRTVALDEDIEQRIRIAASLLAAYRIQAHVSPWDGTRCDLLIANVADAYGRQALGLAIRRGTPVVVIGNAAFLPDGAVTLSETTQAPDLARQFHDLLADGTAPRLARKQANGIDEGVERKSQSTALICHLAEPTLRGHRVEIIDSTRRVTLCPNEGRVFAATHSDLHAARDALGGNLWKIQPKGNAPVGEVSASLDSFLLLAALRVRDQLPAMDQSKHSLRYWPDLGAVPELIGALRAARTLLAASLDVEQLAARCQIDRATANAYLWAFSAANLLEVKDAATPRVPTPQPAATARGLRGNASLFSRIAARFGLAPRQPRAL